MKKQQIIFTKVKDVLKQHLKAEINEYENGSYLSIGDTGIWISFDEQELTIGYGFSHTHYNPEFDNMLESVSEIFDLLTKRKKVTVYYKGTFQFKNKSEIEISENEFKYIGTSMTWLYPFWKRTKEIVIYFDKLIDETSIQKEMNEIKTYSKS